MKPVMDLNDIRSMGRDDFLKTGIPISCNVRQFRVTAQPIRQCLSFPIGQEVDGMMSHGITN
ncbi:hypothetical protein GCM10007176_04140 [Salinicoccus roseus]|nr:hypothetical protein GCM10007176_04140 [Salinicoccus roseus]